MATTTTSLVDMWAAGPAAAAVVPAAPDADEGEAEYVEGSIGGDGTTSTTATASSVASPEPRRPKPKRARRRSGRSARSAFIESDAEEGGDNESDDGSGPEEGHDEAERWARELRLRNGGETAAARACRQAMENILGRAEENAHIAAGWKAEARKAQARVARLEAELVAARRALASARTRERATADCNVALVNENAELRDKLELAEARALPRIPRKERA